MVPAGHDQPEASGTEFSAPYYANYAHDDSSWLTTYNQRRLQYGSLIAMLRQRRANINDICEVGCGVGMFSYALLRAFPENVNLIAGDISDYAVETTRARLRGTPRTLVKTLDAESIDLSSGCLDVLVSLDVVEHLQHPELFFQEALRVLRPGGLLLFSTPNPESLGSRVKNARLIGDDKQFLWFALHDESHVNIRTINAWRVLCRDNGFARSADGSDYLWDTPYFRSIPTSLQKLVFIGTRRIFSPITPFLPWRLGENYYGIWYKP